MGDMAKAIEQYNQLKSIRDDCVKALAEKEVTAPVTVKFSELASYIDKIVSVNG